MVRVIVLFVGATIMACAEPIESIDTTEAELVRESHLGEIYHDHEYAAAVANRTLELTLMYMDRLTAEDVARLEAGEMTSQEALDLTDAEHDALFSELQYLAAESEAILAARGNFVLPQKNDGRGPHDREAGCDDQIDDCTFGAGLTASGFGVRYGPAVFVGLALAGGAFCLCRHCKGYKAIKKACEVVKQ